jgi:hypothetical protein
MTPHNHPILCGYHPVKTLLSRNFLLMVIESKPFGDGIALGAAFQAKAFCIPAFVRSVVGFDSRHFPNFLHIPPFLV